MNMENSPLTDILFSFRDTAVTVPADQDGPQEEAALSLAETAWAASIVAVWIARTGRLDRRAWHFIVAPVQIDPNWEFHQQNQRVLSMFPENQAPTPMLGGPYRSNSTQPKCPPG